MRNFLLAEIEALQMWFAAYNGGNPVGKADRERRYDECLNRLLDMEV